MSASDDFIAQVRRWREERDALSVENAHLRTVVEAQSKLVSAAQKFFGRDGSRWFDRPECALRAPVASRDGHLPRCTCGGHDMGRALAELDKATIPTDEAVRALRMGDQS